METEQFQSRTSSPDPKNLKEIDKNEFFITCWTAILDLITSKGDLDLMLEILMKTVYYFEASRAEFEKKHSNFLKRFSKAVKKRDLNEVKDLTQGEALRAVLVDVKAVLLSTKRSQIRALKDLLEFVKVRIIEKCEGKQDVIWGGEKAYFNFYLTAVKNKSYLVYGNKEIELDDPVENLNTSLDELSAVVDEEILTLFTDKDECILERSLEEGNTDWVQVQLSLNHGRSPIFLTTGLVEEMNINENALSKQELVLIDSKNFLKSLVIALIRQFIKQELFYRALSLFSTVVYHFPQSHCRDFESKHRHTIKQFISYLNQNSEESSLKALQSTEMNNLLSEIQSFAASENPSLVYPFFPLLTSSKISLVERTSHLEYCWKPKISFLTITVYQKSNNLFLFVPRGGFPLKQKIIKDKSLEQLKDYSELEGDLSEMLIVEDDEVLEINEDLDNELIRGSQVSTPESKTVKFRPEIEIEIPSPTTPYLIKKNVASKNPQKKTVMISPKPTVIPIPKPPAKEEIQIPLGRPPRPKKVEKEAMGILKEVIPVKEKSGSTKTRTGSASNFQFAEKNEVKEETKEPVRAGNKKKSLSCDRTKRVDKKQISCASRLCTACWREVVRTSEFLDCLNFRKGSGLKSNEIDEEYCGLCCARLVRKLVVYCMDCYFHIVICKDSSYVAKGDCRNSNMTFWVDIRQGDASDMRNCNFCSIRCLAKCLFSACEKCDDLVCLVCLRKNEYLAEGVCNVCKSRRSIKKFNS